MGVIEAVMMLQLQRESLVHERHRESLVSKMTPELVPTVVLRASLVLLIRYLMSTVLAGIETTGENSKRAVLRCK